MGERIETYTREQERYIELAEAVDAVWERILEAKMEFIAEKSPPMERPAAGTANWNPVFVYQAGGGVEYAPGQPPQIEPPQEMISRGGQRKQFRVADKRVEQWTEGGQLRRLDDEAQFASQLFERALSRFAELDDRIAPHSRQKTAAGSEAPRPAPKKPPKRFHATRRTDEEIAAYTQQSIDEARVAIRGSETEDRIAKAAREKREAAKRKFTTGDTVFNIRQDGRQIEQRIRNYSVIAQDEFDQVLLWTGQAWGPRQAPHRQTSEARTDFTINMVNMGRLDEKLEMSDAEYWDHVDAGIEQGLLVDPNDPQLTPAGYDHVHGILLEAKTAKIKQWGPSIQADQAA